MKTPLLRSALAAAALLVALQDPAARGEATPARAGDAAPAPGAGVFPIDLPSAMRLAGANNLDVRIAGERLAEANASRKIALEKFFPSISGGIAYRRHDGAIQNVQGDIETVHKESYAPGAVVSLQADIGDAIFRSLEAKQLVKAAGHGLDAERQRAVAAAASAYLELVRSVAAIDAASEALGISTVYSEELHAAVKIGIAFEGDALQAGAKASEDRLALRHAEEQNRLAAVKLAGLLDLDPAVTLAPRDKAPVSLSLFAAAMPVADQVAAALAAHPELQRRLAERDAAREAERGAKYGPLAPTFDGTLFAGGTGGGSDAGAHRFDDSEDYVVGLQWKLGPGGLFDIGRIENSEARQREAELTVDKTRREITDEVLSSRERVDSLAAQMVLAEKSLADSRDSLQLKRQRKDYGVAAVLETIQAERDWTRALDDYLAKITDYDKAQFDLLRATGALGGADPAIAPQGPSATAQR